MILCPRDICGVCYMIVTLPVNILCKTREVIPLLSDMRLKRNVLKLLERPFKSDQIIYILFTIEAGRCN